MRRLCLAASLIALPAAAIADPLTGKSFIIQISAFIIQISATQNDSGYAKYLIRPLASVMNKSGMRPQNGPGADLVVNVETDSDVGRWVGDGGDKVWLYTISATVGLSPESYAIPFEGTPAFGVTASLETVNPDREDEMNCLIKLAARTALANYRPTGIVKVNGTSCRHR